MTDLFFLDGGRDERAGMKTKFRWSNLWIIMRREVRDQIRDRRTLFMIFVLPILLYPMLMFGMLQVLSALEQKPRVVVVVGSENLPPAPPLLDPSGKGFSPDLFDSPGDAGRMVVERQDATSDWADPRTAESAIRHGLASAVVIIPKDLRDQLKRDVEIAIPIQYNSVDEPSQITQLRLKDMLARWKASIVAGRLARDRKDKSYTEPIEVRALDVATADEKGGNVWSRLFPFLLVMMSLTGAFYPAVDLCAGEKERGTMETLLISPASRSEIVLCKFLTVMLASVTTAILNLLSMGLTGMQVARQFGEMGGGAGRRAVAASFAAPSPQSTFWMLVLLIPLAAFFSAVCLALAVLARSMKEGQYYMTPLYMICLPLVFLTLSPEIELNLFNSLLPITGVALLLRALIMGNYDTAAQFFLPVLVPTLIYAAVALRWAIDQFQREDVLFREAERFNVVAWLRHLIRDREPTPTGAQAVLCFALILSASWFLTLYLSSRGAGVDLATVAAGQLMIMIPPVIMAFMLTRCPFRTLRLTIPEGRYLLLALGLVIALNPLVNELRPLVEWLFPIRRQIAETLGKMMAQAPSLPIAILSLAIMPAVCEELAFRGFILSGLEHQRRTRSAIVLSAFLFGFLHVLLSLFQQLFNATLLGVVLGLLAVRGKSLLPGIVFHAINNAWAITLPRLVGMKSLQPALSAVFRDPAQGLYHEGWLALGVVCSAGLLYHLWRLRFIRPPEPSLAAPVVVP